MGSRPKFTPKSTSYEVPATLDGPGIKFHGARRRDNVPQHVRQAIRDAAQAVLDNYTRVGTPCGHEPSTADENRCAVMICQHSTRHAETPITPIPEGGAK